MKFRTPSFSTEATKSKMPGAALFATATRTSLSIAVERKRAHSVSCPAQFTGHIESVGSATRSSRRARKPSRGSSGAHPRNVANGSGYRKSKGSKRRVVFSSSSPTSTTETSTSFATFARVSTRTACSFSLAFSRRASALAAASSPKARASHPISETGSEPGVPDRLPRAWNGFASCVRSSESQCPRRVARNRPKRTPAMSGRRTGGFGDGAISRDDGGGAIESAPSLLSRHPFASSPRNVNVSFLSKRRRRTRGRDVRLTSSRPPSPAGSPRTPPPTPRC